jgi:hypothetical protein
MKVRRGVVAKRPSRRGSPSPSGRNGGRTWWAHFEFTRINIELTILPKKFEDVREVGPNAWRHAPLASPVTHRLTLTQIQQW